MAESTVTSPLFLKSAEELADRLARVGGPLAASLAEEARALAATFRDWGSSRPDDAVRVAGIQRLFDVNRRAMDLLAKAGPASSPSSGVRPIVTDDDDDDEGEDPVRAIGAPPSRRRA